MSQFPYFFRIAITTGVILFLLSYACSLKEQPLLPLPSPAIISPSPSVSDSPFREHILVGAGDIASCDSDYDEATAKLLDSIKGTVFTVGDNVYPNGSMREFSECYHPTWGRHKDRTRPAIGNHEYHTKYAAGYFAYFGLLAGIPNKGNYSYNVGDWHIVVLNSNCSEVGGCYAHSPQAIWLKTDLANEPKKCTLAYMHHPRFSPGRLHGSNTSMQPFWHILYDAGVEVVLVGHDHLYERFAPQTPDGKLDPERGIRQFIVGTGGRSLYEFGQILPNSEVRNSTTYGVLKMTLRSTDYTWEFVPVTSDGFHDSGTDECH